MFLKLMKLMIKRWENYMTSLQTKISRIVDKVLKQDIDRKVRMLEGKVNGDFLNWKDNKIMSPEEESNITKSLAMGDKLHKLYSQYDKYSQNIKELEKKKHSLEVNKRHVIKHISVDFYFNTDIITIDQSDINKYIPDEVLNSINEHLNDIIDILIADNYKKLEEITEEIRCLLKS